MRRGEKMEKEMYHFLLKIEVEKEETRGNEYAFSSPHLFSEEENREKEERKERFSISFSKSNKKRSRNSKRKL